MILSGVWMEICCNMYFFSLKLSSDFISEKNVFTSLKAENSTWFIDFDGFSFGDEKIRSKTCLKLDEHIESNFKKNYFHNQVV